MVAHFREAEDALDHAGGVPDKGAPAENLYALESNYGDLRNARLASHLKKLTRRFTELRLERRNKRRTRVVADFKRDSGDAGAAGQK